MADKRKPTELPERIFVAAFPPAHDVAEGVDVVDCPICQEFHIIDRAR
jgi:hypothetical protein